VDIYSAGAGSRAWPQTFPPWYTACRTCCLRAALVGGISWTLFFLANSLQRALLTSVENEFRSLFNLLATILMIFLKKQLIKFGA